MLCGLRAAFEIHVVKNLANDVEGRHEIRAAIADEETHFFAHSSLHGIVTCHGSDRAVKDNVVWYFSERLLHAEWLQPSLTMRSFGVELGLEDIELFVHFWQAADGLDEDEAIHAIRHMHAHRGGGAVIDIQAGVQRLERKHGGVTWCREGGCGPATRSGHGMKVDVVRHLAVRAIHEVKLHLIVLSDSDEFARHAAAEGPERVVHAISHALHQFDDFELDGDLRGMITRDGWRNIRRIGEHRVFRARDRLVLLLGGIRQCVARRCGHSRRSCLVGLHRLDESRLGHFFVGAEFLVSTLSEQSGDKTRQ